MYEKCFFLSPAYANRKKINISGTFSLQASGHCIDRTSCCIHIIYHQDILSPDISCHAERFFFSAKHSVFSATLSLKLSAQY